MRILISTFGPDPENTFAAMRSLSYEKLVLFLSKEDMDTPGFVQIMEAERNSKGEVENVFMNKYDFQNCFRCTVDYVLKFQTTDKKRREIEDIISINISGGSKIMGDAVLLAAFQTGIRAYHCEKGRVIRFPVIENISLRDRFTRSQMAVLKTLGRRDTVEDIARKIGAGLTEETIRKSLRKLKKMGIIQTLITEGQVVSELTEAGIFILETVSRLDRDAI